MTNVGGFFPLEQNIVPESATQAVKELFVPASRQASAKTEAESLPALEISKVRFSFYLTNVCVVSVGYRACVGCESG
jgi:hypothetical protein